MQTRTTKELFELMLENKDLFDRGICQWILNIYNDNKIKLKEKWNLEDYIIRNKPSIFYSWEVFKQRYNNKPYYWKKDNLEQRVKWIKKQIKKLK